MVDNILKPLFTSFSSIIRNTLKPIFDGLTNVANNVFKPVFSSFALLVRSVLKPIFDTFDSVVRSLKRSLGSLTGGGVGGTAGDIVKGVQNLFKFHDGGKVTQSELLRLPGMQSNEGLAVLQAGETVIPNHNESSSNVSSNMTMNFNISSSSPRENVEEIRQLIEELSLTGRLNIAA